MISEIDILRKENNDLKAKINQSADLIKTNSNLSFNDKQSAKCFAPIEVNSVVKQVKRSQKSSQFLIRLEEKITKEDEAKTLIVNLVLSYFQKEKRLEIKPKHIENRNYGIYVRFHCNGYFKLKSSDRKIYKCKKFYTARYVFNRTNIIVSESLDDCKCVMSDV